MSAELTPAPQPSETEIRVGFVRPLPALRPPGDSSATNGTAEIIANSNGAARDDIRQRLFPRPSDGQPAETPSVAGVTLGHFIIDERIGSGGMGAVFRAVDTRLDRVVALKVLAPELAGDPQAARRFRNEARAAARLDHENIARVHFVGDDGGMPFIAFEYVRGTNVRDFLVEKGALPPAEAVNYAFQIAQALRQTSAAGVVHRDIKPSNIIVTPSGRAKLVDLGLARQEETGANAANQELTVAGTTLGTFDYIAPEQAIDPRNVDVRTDIYALGCTLYHMLTGEPPYPQGSAIQKVVDHHHSKPPDPASRNRAIPLQLSRIVRRMMASDPAQRYAGPDPLLQDLSRVAVTLGLHPTHPDTVIWQPPIYSRSSLLWQQNRGWVATLAVLILIVLGVSRWPSGFGPTASVPAGETSSQRTRASQSSPSSDSAAGTAVPSSREPTFAGTADITLPTSSASADTPGDVPHWVARVTALAVPPAPEAPPTADPALVASAQDAGRQSRDNLQPSVLVTPADDVSPSMEPIAVAPSGVPSAIVAVPDVSGTPVASGAPFLLTAPGDVAPREFETLEAACAAAPDNARITLNFDGWHPLPQEPISIRGKRLTLRAADGMRPAILLRPATRLGTVQETQMIRVIDGSLKLFDIDIAVVVQPDDVSPRWSVLSMSRSAELIARCVSITVVNPAGAAASVLEVAARDTAAQSPVGTPLNELRVDISDSLFRGDCDFLLQHAYDPGWLQLRNLAVGIRGTLLRIQNDSPHEALHGDLAELIVQLRHCTVMAGEGLLRMDAGEARQRALLRWDSRENVFSSPADQPLFSISGTATRDRLLSILQWSGEANYFDSSDILWQVDATGGDDAAAWTLPFADWNRRWNGSFDQQASRVLQTAADGSRVAWDRLQPEHFRLRRPQAPPALQNPAIGGASDGTDAGVHWESSYLPDQFLNPPLESPEP